MKPALYKSRQLPEQRPSPEWRTGEQAHTGMVRQRSAPASEPRSTPARSDRPSGVRLTQRAARAWRCLQPYPPEQQSPRRDASVSIAQVSLSGARLRQSGPDEWLPEAAEFVHRAALLVAQGLGFERCSSVCLQGPESLLQVSDAGPCTITGVSGPSWQLSNVRRARGLK